MKKPDTGDAAEQLNLDIGFSRPAAATTNSQHDIQDQQSGAPEETSNVAEIGKKANGLPSGGLFASEAAITSARNTSDWNEGIHSEVQPTTAETSEEVGAKESPHWQNAYQISGAAVITGLVLLVVASLQMENPTAGIPENFRVTDVTPADPILRAFPNFAMPASGERIQAGLFSRLAGAETHQMKLARLGLLPHIEKRASGGDTLYAVMLGPLDPAEHKKATRILDQNNLSYFHKPKRGS